MRLRKALALTAALVAVSGLSGPAALPAAAAVAAPAPPGGGGARPAPALPSGARATCGDGVSTAFPIGARIRGGPAVYRIGAAPQTWYLDLTNTTASACTAIHPVVVFTDKTRSLRPAHLRMEFDARGTTFPVSLEGTDRDEVIAVFDGGEAFPGFTVGPGGSATVKVRLAFAADAPAGEVVADAALVQRKGDDGDWVGDSGGYRFSVEGPRGPQDPLDPLDPLEAGAGVGAAGEEDEGEAGAGAAGSGALAETGAGGGGAARGAEREREWVYGGGAVGAVAVGGGLVLLARRLRRESGRTA
ncbi:hypothetical protein ABZY31_04045 [Streptomyces sp. NPDC006529]|uniref:hypothetical protein n=1 Tax=Streptomyces sp. NPDC006529 TaxID=3157177 RepID=UPI0033A06D85